MLSILLPVYNVDCFKLVQQLYEQAIRLDTPFEILVADDASPSEDIKNHNRLILQWKECRYIQLKQNVGPAVIRNVLADEAKYDCLVFLDSDIKPIHVDFLQVYLNSFKRGGVVCGGFKYLAPEVFPVCPLRYKYGIKVETATASQRSKAPYARFIGMNFCIDKAVFLKVRFDEQMHFGYEDARFGCKLQEKGIPIRHIENPVWHLSADTSTEYLSKIRKAVFNLYHHQEGMLQHVRLLQMYTYCKRWHLTAGIGLLFRVFRADIERNLKGRYPSLYLFALYKLGYMCTL